MIIKNVSGLDVLRWISKGGKVIKLLQLQQINLML